MIIATAGHVDHGKTSLVKALTGIETDLLKEEKQRGLTIDLGFAYIDAETGGRLGFVDVPGHIRFINNMLAGVAGIDFALLVIAADDGIMPQTVEHLEVLQLLGIQRGLIALTKIDRADPAPAIQDIHQLVTGTFLEDAEIYPVSSTTGDGVEMLKIALDIAADELHIEPGSGMFRLAVDRRFSVHGAGIVVTGSVFAGEVTEGATLTLMPQNIPVRVRGLRVQDQPATTAKSGDRCAVNLTAAKLDLEDIHRGNWLTQNSGHPSTRIDVRLDVSRSGSAIKHWTPVHLHTGANHVTARVALLDSRVATPGESALAQLVLDEPVNVCTGDRYVVRDQAASKTLGGGTVLNPWSVKRGRAKPERVKRLGLIDPDSAEGTLGQLLKTELYGVDLSEFSSQFNLKHEETLELVEMMDVLKISERRIITKPAFDRLLVDAVQQVEGWHEQNPGKPGLPLNQFEKLLRHPPRELVSQIVMAGIESGDLAQNGNLVHRSGFGLQLNQKELAIFEQVHPLIESTKPPVLHDLAKSVGESPKALEKILNQVVKTGQIIRPAKNRYFLPEMMDVLKSQLEEAADDSGQFTVQQYRDVAGTGRNLAIELLEYFDRTGVTRRLGDVRQIIR